MTDGEKRAYSAWLRLCEEGRFKSLEVEVRWFAQLAVDMQVTVFVPRNESDEEMVWRRQLKRAVRKAYESVLSGQFLKEMTSPPLAECRRLDEMLGLFESLGVKDTDRNCKKYGLWEELNPLHLLSRKCPYSGAIISAEDVFMKGGCEVDHIVPNDDGETVRCENLVLCIRNANIEKGHRTPWVAWGGVRWNAIKE